MPRHIDLTGLRFGKLVVLRRAENRKGRVCWECECECGRKLVTRGDNLTSGRTQSCGCYNRARSSSAHTRHGESDTRIYNIWRKMKSRCATKIGRTFKDYGGRGITVCQEWLDSFEAFRDWALENGYRDDLTIDRKNNDGDYCPENCRWITNQEQQNNRRDNHLLEYKGETHTITEWARKQGISENALVHRIQRGWDIERALLTPTAKK